MDFLFYAFSVLIFVAVALVIEAAWQWWFSTQSAAAKRASRRLSNMIEGDKQSTERTSLLKDRRLAESAQAEQLLRRIPGLDKLDITLQQSGSKWSVAVMMTYTALFFLGALLLSLFFDVYLLLALTIAVACSSLPTVSILRKRASRLSKLERQLPEATDLIARSLRAGHAFPSTLQMVAEELPDPIASEFRIVADEINYGVAIADALPRLAIRVPLTDMRYLVVAVLIQRETGGNLAELMISISALIRDRLKLMGQIRTLSAEGRMSAWVLCLLPVGVALMMWLVNPQYIGKLVSDKTGFQLLMTAGAMMALGGLWMRKIIRIRL